LCNPRDYEGRNRPPSGDEVANCSQHLIRLIDILDPRWVITLGAVALAAAELVEPHGCHLRTHVGRTVRWLGRTLVPLYHPGPRALIHRPLRRQLSDYRAVGRLIRQKREDAWPAAVAD
jgi:uracil-DNA glycosylase